MTSPSSAGSEKRVGLHNTLPAGLGVAKSFNFNFCAFMFIYSVFSDPVVKWRYSQSKVKSVMHIV